MDFVKDPEELYDKTNEHFKDKGQEGMPVGEVHQHLQVVCQSVQDLVGILKDLLQQLTQFKSGKAHKEITESQKWIQNKLIFLKTYTRHKGLSKSSAFMSPARGASASTTSAHNFSRCSTDTDGVDQTPEYSLQFQAPGQFPSIQQLTRRSWTRWHR